jgi:hypothetical protein
MTMKRNKRYRVNPEKIGSLQALELEKARLKLEIMKSEENIRSDYHRIADAFTLRNLAAGLIEDIAVTSNVFSKAVSVGKSFFAKRKKKKQHHSEEQVLPVDPASIAAEKGIAPEAMPPE